MGRVAFVILLFCSLSMSAQKKLSFVELDTTTYRQYLESDWKALIETGKEGLDQGINYYYLQMRIAYAHYRRGEYRAAIKYYNQALELNSQDQTANEFLYYCYLYSGRSNDALLQTKFLTADQKQKMNLIDADSSIILSIGLSYTYASTNSTSIQENIISGITSMDVLQDGVQKSFNYFHLPKLTLSNKFGKHVTMNHSFSYLQKNEFSYVISGLTTYQSAEQIMNQVEYGTSLEIVPAKGWMIRPGINFINIKIPLFDIGSYGPGSGNDRTVYEYQEIRNRTFSLMLGKEFRFFNIGLSYSNNDFNKLRSHQAGIHSTIYPLSNLDLYYSFDFYYQYLLQNEVSQGNYIYRHTLGFKIFKNLWMEVSNTIPEQMNFYDIRNNISFNSIEKIGSAYSASLIFPVYKAGLKFFGNFGYNLNNSYFFPEQDMLNPLNKHSYNSYIITGGIKWTK